MLKKLCPHLYALTLVCSSNIIVEIAPYSDILCLNGWTYKSLPLILVLRYFGATWYSWLEGLLINPWSGVQTPQVLGYSELRMTEPLVRDSNP
jgi:hypothetical protein